MIPESITYTESVEIVDGVIVRRWPKASMTMKLESPTEINEATDFVRKYVEDTIAKANQKNYFQSEDNIPILQNKDR